MIQYHKQIKYVYKYMYNVYTICTVHKNIKKERKPLPGDKFGNAKSVHVA